jgi:hypothetical protein
LCFSSARRYKGLWLAVDEVIHHDDVMLLIIRPWGNIAACDLNPGNAGVIKHDAKEGQARIAW